VQQAKAIWEVRNLMSKISFILILYQNNWIIFFWAKALSAPSFMPQAEAMWQYKLSKYSSAQAV
jgi:hypothetical protein